MRAREVGGVGSHNHISPIMIIPHRSSPCPPVARALRPGLHLVLALLLLPLATSRAATLVWTNLAGGAWDHPANRSPTSVPGTSDHAFITNAVTYAVTLPSSVAARLTLGGTSGTQTLRHLGGTLSLHSASVVRAGGVLEWNAGILAGG